MNELLSEINCPNVPVLCGLTRGSNHDLVSENHCANVPAICGLTRGSNYELSCLRKSLQMFHCFVGLLGA